MAEDNVSGVHCAEVAGTKRNERMVHQDRLNRISLWGDSMTTHESKYLRFVEIVSTATTHQWIVQSKSRASKLGRVKWYGAWFEYVFLPEPDTIFNTECLQDIASFLKQETDKWGESR